MRGLRARRFPRIGGVVTVAGSADALARVATLVTSTSTTNAIRGVLKNPAIVYLTHVVAEVDAKSKRSNLNRGLIVSGLYALSGDERLELNHSTSLEQGETARPHAVRPSCQVADEENHRYG